QTYAAGNYQCSHVVVDVGDNPGGDRAVRIDRKRARRNRPTAPEIHRWRHRHDRDEHACKTQAHVLPRSASRVDNEGKSYCDERTHEDCAYWRAVVRADRCLPTTGMRLEVLEHDGNAQESYRPDDS